MEEKSEGIFENYTGIGGNSTMNFGLVVHSLVAQCLQAYHCPRDRACGRQNPAHQYVTTRSVPTPCSFVELRVSDQGICRRLNGNFQFVRKIALLSMEKFDDKWLHHATTKHLFES